MENEEDQAQVLVVFMGALIFDVYVFLDKEKAIDHYKEKVIDLITEEDPGCLSDFQREQSLDKFSQTYTRYISKEHPENYANLYLDDEVSVVRDGPDNVASVLINLQGALITDVSVYLGAAQKAEAHQLECIRDIMIEHMPGKNWITASRQTLLDTYDVQGGSDQIKNKEVVLFDNLTVTK